MALGGVQAHLDVTSFIYDLSWRWGFHAGVHGLYPNANTNPFHKKFPYWLPDKDKKSLVGERFRTLQAPEPKSLGRTLVNNIYYNANPHFLDDKHVVFNDLGKASDYNDDHIALTRLHHRTMPRAIPSSRYPSPAPLPASMHVQSAATRRW